MSDAKKGEGMILLRSHATLILPRRNSPTLSRIVLEFIETGRREVFNRPYSLEKAAEVCSTMNACYEGYFRFTVEPVEP
ncbi:hypothetical protein BH11ARM2_BH11ARM2_23220 [soil metagenome]